MLSSIFSAFSGMLGFSKGLDVISNNVANMNTTGFKAGELKFADMFYRYGLSHGGSNGDQIGQGVSTGSTRTNYGQGELRETTEALDTAINGNGFFILRKDGETFYTRNGQFQFNDQGILIETGSGARVAALNGGQLADISISGLRVNPPRPTSEISFTGTLDLNAAATSPYTLSNVTVIDGAGGTRTLTILFTNNNSVTARSWLVEVREGANTIHNGQIQFEPAGTPLANFNTITFNYAPAGAPASAITLNFGEPGSITGTRSFSGAPTNVSVSRQNGLAAGSLMESSFNENGVLTLRYSNGEVTMHDRLALAWFQDLQALTLAGGNLFRSQPGQTPVVAGARDAGMGRIVSRHIEMSNVELTAQFTDMVVIQRGYQASSQVISVANEMAQQLLDLRSRR